MKYAMLINNELIYAKNYYVNNDGRIIINFDKNEDLMIQYGFKKVVDEVPEYDETKEYVMIVGYEENDESIVINYEVKEIELTLEQKRQKDRNKCLKLFAETLSDEQALSVPLVFEEWEIGVEYKIGKRILYGEVLYKVLQNHTSQETWTPDSATSLFARLLAETTDGSVPEWQQPTGSTDAYMTGDRVKYNDKIYECTSDNNVYAPDVYGWKLVE